MPNPILYTERFWISPYVFSCFVALREKKVPFDVRVVALDRQEQQAPEYVKKTLTGRVPALEVAPDFVLCESSAIVEFLDDAFPPPEHPRALPADVRQRARARHVMSWLRSDDTAALRADRPTTSMFYERAKSPLTEAGQQAAKKLLDVA